MRGELPPRGDHAENYFAVRTRKKGARHRILRLVERRVIGRYLEFLFRRGRLELLNARRWPKRAHEALRHCYDGGGMAVDELKARFLADLSDAARMRCPYCMLRQPGTIDHFLPQERFPEFSVFVANWVWVCGTCNLRKGSRMTGPPRAILMPYFDGIRDDVALLFADVCIVNNVPVIFFHVPVPNPLQANPRLPEIAERQVKALGVFNDVSLDAAAFLRTTLNVIVTDAAGPLTQADLSTLLETRRANHSSFGINGWEQALIEALESSPNILAYVNAAIAAKAAPPPQTRPRNVQLAEAIALAAAAA